MKFVAANGRVAGAVQKNNERIHQVEESVFVYIVMLAVEPVNDIASEEVILFKLLQVAGSCHLQ